MRLAIRNVASHLWVLWAAFGCAAGAAPRSTTMVHHPEALKRPAAGKEPASIDGARTSGANSAAVRAMEDAQIGPPCAAEMALVGGLEAAFCIDRFEAAIVCRSPSGEDRGWPGNLPVDGIEDLIVAVSLEGVTPQGYISGLQATRACEQAGKRLCSSEEWVTACRGRAGTRYPYGNQRRAGFCNDRFKSLDDHPVVRLFREAAPPGADARLMWTTPWLNDSRLLELSHTVAPTGSFPECVSDYGVADMVGNLHEWVADSDGVFRGGFFMDTYQHGEGCEYRTSAHPMKYHDYSTGFRCCAEPVSFD